MMLGLQLGKLPSELSQTMLAAEEVAFMAYYKDDPWGDHRRDVGFAQLAQILWNQNAKKENRRKLTDFLPFYRRGKTTEPEPDVENSLKAAFGKLMGKS